MKWLFFGDIQRPYTNKLIESNIKETMDFLSDHCDSYKNRLINRVKTNKCYQILIIGCMAVHKNYSRDGLFLHMFS